MNNMVIVHADDDEVEDEIVDAKETDHEENTEDA
jgi:hypothetical protein